MKYIKTYEDSNEKPKIGDYVITNWNFPDDPSWAKYINDRIGQIVEIDNHIDLYYCKYELDDDIFYKFFRRRSERKLTYDENGKHYINMKIKDHYLKVFSPDKEKLAMLLAGIKYNL